jgi:peroxiredoxin/predicted 2-oxoglutarate/Fe(II)-dependent dioxygenase YbiX
MHRYINLRPGDPAPWFHQVSYANPNYAFDTAAGRYIVLCFFRTARDAHSQAAISAVRSYSKFFNDQVGSFFGVSNDANDKTERRVADHYPGYRFFWDFDGSVSKLYGALPVEVVDDQRVPIRRIWVVIDPTLRIVKVVPFEQDRTDIDVLLNFLRSLPPPARFAGVELQAPILLLPNVFEPELCQKLISLYEAHGGESSGFMREVDGKTVRAEDDSHKRRRDYLIEDQSLIADLQTTFKRRIVPEIKKAYQFVVTRMERYIVACYSAEESGHFRAHRDNTTKGTAHRRFAVSVNLNDDFEGGEVSFPEYGPRSFKPPIGGAAVFSCSLLHAVSTVTRGRRYAFLPFLYDDAAAKLREANNAFLGEGIGDYKAR